MKSTNGWVKLHRQILDWEWFDDHNTFRLFMYCLLKANHQDKRYKGKVIERGSFVTGREMLSVEVGLSIQQVRTSLNKLKSTNEITINSTKKGTVIQVVNYDSYQEVTNKATDNQPTDNQQVTTNKNVKKEKKAIPSVEEFVSYALDKQPDIDTNAVRLKYEAWAESGWKVKDRPIKVWKTTLLNTLPYLPKLSKQQKRTLPVEVLRACMSVPAMMQKKINEGWTREEIEKLYSEL